MTAFARLRETFFSDREPQNSLFCTFGLDHGFFEAEILPALLPQSLTYDREAGSKEAYQRAADAALATKGVTVFFDHLTGDGPELTYEDFRVDVAHAFHPKLAVLDYGDLIRVVVSSANLTRPAWSSLLELFVVEDLRPGVAHPWARPLETFLGQLSRQVAPRACDVAAELTRRVATVPEGPGASKLVSSWEGPIIDELLDGVAAAKSVDVVTPFFEGDDGPGVFDALAKRLGLKVGGTIWTRVELIDGRSVVRGPEDKLRALLDSRRWQLRAVDAVWDGDEKDAVLRALHGKLIAIRHGRLVRLVVGSPNATRAGLLAKAPNGNVELAVVTDVPANRIREILPQGRPVDADTIVFVNDGDPTGEDASGEPGAERWVLAATYSAAACRLTLTLEPSAPKLEIRYGDRLLDQGVAPPEWTCPLVMGAQRYVVVDDGTSRAVVPFIVVDPEQMEPRWTVPEATLEDFLNVLAGDREALPPSDDHAPQANGSGSGNGSVSVARGPIPWRRYLAALRGLGRELEREATFYRGLLFVLQNPSRLAGLLDRLERACESRRFTGADFAYALYELEREVRRASRLPGIPDPCRLLFEEALADLAARRDRTIEGASPRLRRQLDLLSDMEADR